MKPSLFLKAARLRLKIRCLWCTWFCPQVLVDERESAALNRELRRHWPDRQMHVVELLHEQWDSDENFGDNILDNRFIVFIDHELAIDWIANENLSAEAKKSVAVAEAVGARRCKHLPREQVLEFKRLVGQAIVCAINSNAEEAAGLAQQSSDFLKARTTERSRYWSLMSSHLLFFIAVVVAIFFWPKLSEVIQASKGSGVGALGGFLGAYFSVVQSAGKGAWDSASGPWIHFVEVFTKIIAGILLGGVACIFAQSVHAPPSLKAITPDLPSIFILGIGAGFLERVIPRMISQYTNNLTKTNNEP